MRNEMYCEYYYHFDGYVVGTIPQLQIIESGKDMKEVQKHLSYRLNTMFDDAEYYGIDLDDPQVPVTVEVLD